MSSSSDRNFAANAPASVSLPTHFSASNDMKPETAEERGLRSYIFTKTILSETLQFLRGFHEHVASGHYGKDAQELASRLGNSYTFSQSLKEIAVAQIHLTLSEQKIHDEEWFSEFMAASGWLLDQQVLASPVHEILTSLCVSGSRGVCSEVAESILRGAGLVGCQSYWLMKDEISSYIEHCASLRQRFLQYALTQSPEVLNEYLFAMQLFE